MGPVNQCSADGDMQCSNVAITQDMGTKQVNSWPFNDSLAVAGAARTTSSNSRSLVMVMFSPYCF